MTTKKKEPKKTGKREKLVDDAANFKNKIDYNFNHIDDLSEYDKEDTLRIVGELENHYKNFRARGKQRSNHLYDVWEVWVKSGGSVNSAKKVVIEQLKKKSKEINDEIKSLEEKSRSFTSYEDKILAAKKTNVILGEEITLLEKTHQDTINNWFLTAYNEVYAEEVAHTKDQEKKKKNFIRGLNFEQLKVLTNESKYVLLTYRPKINGTQVDRMVVREISQFLNMVSGTMETTEKIYQINPFNDEQDNFYDMQESLKEYFINKEDNSFSLNEKIIYEYILNFDGLIEDNIYSKIDRVKSFSQIEENSETITIEVQGLKYLWNSIEEDDEKDEIVTVDLMKQLTYATKINLSLDTEIRQQINKLSPTQSDKFSWKVVQTRDDCLFRRIARHNWTPNIFCFFYNEFLRGKMVKSYSSTNYSLKDIIDDVDGTYECLIDFFGEEKTTKKELQIGEDGATEYVETGTIYNTNHSVNDKQLYYDVTIWNYDKDIWNDSEGRRYTSEEKNKRLKSFNLNYLEMWNTLSDLKRLHEYYNSEEYSNLMDEEDVEVEEFYERFENGKYLSEVLPGFGRIVYDALENGWCQHYIEYLTFLQMKRNDLSIKYEDKETKDKLERYVGSINAIIFDIKQKQK